VQRVTARRKSLVREVLEILFLAVLIYVVVQYAVQTVHVLGFSMDPTLSDNDLLIMSKISYRLHAPERGDIIVIEPAGSGDHRDLIKRVIAVPGDRLRISGGRITVNGHPLEEPYVFEPWTSNNTVYAGQERVMPPDSYFVLGDNRNHSRDSRSFGYVKRRAILGKAEVRIWPLSEISLLNRRPVLAGN
jgi:signal peptidase I